MATEQPPALTSLGRPREPSVPRESAGPDPSQPVEFRGFEYFSQRDFNEFKDASRAYFAEKNGAPASWLGDATPPASAHPSFDERRPAPAAFSYQPNEQERRGEGNILGFRKQWFWTILAIIAVIIVVAVGVGVGVGTTRAAGGSKSASAVSPASDATGTAMPGAGSPTTAGVPAVPSSPSTTSTNTPATSSSPAPVVTPEAVPGCPEINGTIYQVPGSTKRFLQLCGLDHGKQDGAVDIRNVYTETADDCIDNCAGTNGCTGCGWGFIEGDKGPPYRCWLKSNVNPKSHSADPSWHFAMLL
ncbi:hypothetical protein F4777DRAFT_4355 [Nemania sp. FL0916]|nr:hypothetical protein F4777DRAFT_4355 [Nemania sp. FL0916]